MEDETITVEVAYALPDKQTLLEVEVNNECSAIEAVRRSGIVDIYPEIDLEQIKMGIFSKACDLEQILKEGNRVEIYRPLIADPKEVRKRRAAEMAAKNAQQKIADKT